MKKLWNWSPSRNSMEMASLERWKKVLSSPRSTMDQWTRPSRERLPEVDR
jgi:hypothetical protein